MKTVMAPAARHLQHPRADLRRADQRTERHRGGRDESRALRGGEIESGQNGGEREEGERGKWQARTVGRAAGNGQAERRSDW